MRKAEQERELRRRERLEKESKDIRTVIEMRATELKARLLLPDLRAEQSTAPLYPALDPLHLTLILLPPPPPSPPPPSSSTGTPFPARAEHHQDDLSG